MGKRTSIYLSDHLADTVKASGLPLGELVRRGLERGSDEDTLRRVLREELAAIPGTRHTRPSVTTAASPG